MKGTYAAIGAFLALIQQAAANLDIITLNTNSDTWIQEAVTTLVVGDTPNPITGDVALWSAIMMDKEDFLQGVTQNSPNNGYCSNLGSNWCNFAYTLVGSSTPKNGSPIIAPPGSRIRTHYKLNSETNAWDQNLYINDKLVSSLTTSKGQRGKIFYVSIECASGTCATAPAHSWENMTVTLNKADKSFGHTGDWEYGATGGEMTTADGGKTWKFATLKVPDTPVQ